MTRWIFLHEMHRAAAAVRQSTDQTIYGSTFASCNTGPFGAVFLPCSHANTAGIQIFLNSPAIELLSEDGEIQGVLAMVGEQLVQFIAPTVIVCSGGFTANHAMVLEAAPELAKLPRLLAGTAPSAVGKGLHEGRLESAFGHARNHSAVRAVSASVHVLVLCPCEGRSVLFLRCQCRHPHAPSQGFQGLWISRWPHTSICAQIPNSFGQYAKDPIV